jgi:endonuclease I
MNTVATTTNLIDAIVHETSDADATELMALLNVAAQADENANGQQTTQSIQRTSTGSYEINAPTPGANNDGSGFIYNGVAINVTANTYNEGDSFNIIFTTQNNVAADLNFTYSLNNGTFDDGDYSGNLSVTIPAGTNSATRSITLTDDTVDDGDELGLIEFGPLPTGYNRLNDNVEIRVIDNDFTTSPWGTPLNPTYGNVTGTVPTGYYDSLEGKSGAALKQAIQDIIADPAVVHAHTYGDIEYILKDADQNPLNSNQVWLMYVEQGRAKYKFQTTSSNVGSWNREHIFPQSRGGFADGTSSQADGIDIWLPTNADDIMAGHGDAHHIRAEDGPENTTRSNRDYGSDYNGPAGNQGSWHGDVARALFYMAVRYNGLNLVNGNPADNIVGQMGDLASLLTWNHSDPRDDFEMHRNNVIYTWQLNRNPFIDYPDLADYIWGSHAGETWFSALATGETNTLNVGVWPNPAKNTINISGLETEAQIEIFSVSGAKLFNQRFNGDTQINLDLSSGIYFARINSEGRATVKKIVIQ